jgi:hypothetical protein
MTSAAKDAGSFIARSADPDAVKQRAVLGASGELGCLAQQRMGDLVADLLGFGAALRKQCGS